MEMGVDGACNTLSSFFDFEGNVSAVENDSSAFLFLVWVGVVKRVSAPESLH